MVTARSSSGWRSISSTGAGTRAARRGTARRCARARSRPAAPSARRRRPAPPPTPCGAARGTGARATSAAPPEQAGDRIHHRRLQRLVERQRRQDPRQAPREHRLARAGRPDEQQVVAAGGRDLERAARDLLPAHVGQVRRLGALPVRPRRRRPRRAGASRALAAQERDQLGSGSAGACTVVAADDRGLGRVVARHEQPPDAAAARPGGDRQHAAHRPQRAVERQLADEQRAVERGRDRRRRPRASMPTAIGTSNAAPSLRRSAGARLTVIRRGGSLKPLFSSAPRMRTRPSRMPASASPTMLQQGSPRPTSTSTWMGAASMPTTVADATRANMPLRHCESDASAKAARGRGPRAAARRPGVRPDASSQVLGRGRERLERQAQAEAAVERALVQQRLAVVRVLRDRRRPRSSWRTSGRSACR